MLNRFREYVFLLVLIGCIAKTVSSQERTVVEFYADVPAVSDYVLDLKSDMTSGVKVQSDGWRIPPGQQVKIEFPFIPPNFGISEVRLGFMWEGQVVSGTFEGWNVDRFKYKVFDEVVYPHENQKRIFPAMLSRGYEFRIKCNLSSRSEHASMILQSLVIYWERVVDEK